MKIKVLTAANCIITTISFTYLGYDYEISVDTTLVNRYKVYLGVQDRTKLTASTVTLAYVSEIIMV